jgi:hypothetical protein
MLKLVCGTCSEKAFGLYSVEVPSSNLIRDITVLIEGFSWFCAVPPRRITVKCYGQGKTSSCIIVQGS